VRKGQCYKTCSEHIARSMKLVAICTILKTIRLLVLHSDHVHALLTQKENFNLKFESAAVFSHRIR
jgi:hypothetical protein